MDDWGPDDQRAHDLMSEKVPPMTWLYKTSKPLSFIRVAFEFVLPVIVGLSAILSLLIRAAHQ
jgi:hypothetical protein